jgi:DNA-binding response OmpR family regulator
MFAVIVDDEALARRRLRGVLESLDEITRIEECDSGRHTVELLHAETPDVLFLDIQMPDIDGFAVAEAARGRPLAVIFVTAYDQYAVRAFAIQALDYLLKPFDDARVIESVRRADAYLRYVRLAAPVAEIDDASTVANRVTFGNVVVDLGRCQVLRDGDPVALRPKEFDLLRALLRRQGRVATRVELLHEVWGYADDVESRTLDTHIAMLRRRLERDAARPQLIITVRTIGYRIDQLRAPVPQPS